MFLRWLILGTMYMCFGLTIQAQELSGQWRAGWVSTTGADDEAGRQEYYQNCVLSSMAEGRLFLEASGAGGYEGGFTQWIALAVDGVQNPTDSPRIADLCELRYSSHPLMGNQVKQWTMALQNDGSSYSVYAHSGDCTNDWCEVSDERFGLRSGADDWSARYTIQPDRIIDNYGTPSTDDDIIFVPESQYLEFAEQGEQYALDFVNALFDGDRSTAYELSYYDSPEWRSGIDAFMVQLRNTGVVPTRANVVLSSVTTSNGPRVWRNVWDLLMSDGVKQRVKVLLAERSDGSIGVSWIWFD